MRQYVALASWGTSCLWMKKQFLVTCMSPIPWKIHLISFEMPLLHFSLSGTLIRFRYSWAFPVSGQMNALALPGYNVSLLVNWLITVQSSPAGRTRGTGLIGVEVGLLMIDKWFSVRSCPCRILARLLYLCSCGTLGVSAEFWCSVGVMGAVSSGVVWFAR